LEVDDLAAWIEVDEKTPVITASVKNGKTNDELGACDTEVTQKIVVMIPVK
jgi:hypothetical protein